MKKYILSLCLLVVLIQVTSCATIVGGQVTESQRTKPLPGEPARQVKMGALVADIFFFGGFGVLVDFATGAIYKPVIK
jgi:hypothetical protein